MNKTNDRAKCGFVAVVGAPNAGKSTLVNALVGSKVSIVSPKVQTTRSIVRGIGIRDDSQIIFLDTPGIFAAKKKLERAIVAAAWEGQKDADVLMLVIDASRHNSAETKDLVEKLATQNRRCPYVLVLNKIDKIKREKLLAMAAEFNEKINFDATFMVSALKNNGVTDVLEYLAEHMPTGVWHYPEDQVSDMPMRLLAAEITREKLFHYMHEELPYGLTVETEKWETLKDGSPLIHQVIYVSRKGHKPIILGKGGVMIKRIGEEARKELEEIMESRIHLKLFVKVHEKWTDDQEHYALWGLDSNA